MKIAFKRILLAAASASVLAIISGCGGGGGGTVTDAASDGIVIRDSFGRIVYSNGLVGRFGGIGGGGSGADGSAGDGAPIVGGTVVLSDASGHSVSAVTDSNGYYSVNVTNFTPPFVAKVTKTNNQVRYSLSVTPLKVNGYVTVNITGLTDKVASDVAVAGGKSGAAQLTPQIVAAHSDVIAQSVSALRTQLTSVITTAGITLSDFDPLSAPFIPDHTGYDFVLDNVVVTVDGSGRTQIAISPTFVPAAPVGVVLAGNWSVTANTAATGDMALGNLVGSAVPTSLAQLNAQTAAAILYGTQNPTVSTANGVTTTITGTTITEVGPGTNYTGTITITNSNYVGCGACGVGSFVSYVYTTSLAGSGVRNGVNVPLTTDSTVMTWRYVRLN